MKTAAAHLATALYLNHKFWNLTNAAARYKVSVAEIKALVPTYRNDPAANALQMELHFAPVTALPSLEVWDIALGLTRDKVRPAQALEMAQALAA